MYTHNYEKLTIPEAEKIIAGTFVQGTTSIAGECITRLYTQTLVANSDKSITSIYPETGADNELVCWFETQDNRVDPTSVRISDITVYVNSTEIFDYALSPYNATVPDGTEMVWSYGTEVDSTYTYTYTDYISPTLIGGYNGVTGVKSTTGAATIPYKVTIGDIESNVAYITVKDAADQQQDMLDAGNSIILVYNLTTLGKTTGDYINVYCAGINPQYSYSRVKNVFAVTTTDADLSTTDPTKLPVRQVSSSEITRGSTGYWTMAITSDMIVDDDKVVLYLQFDKDTTTLPAEIEYGNPHIEKIYIPNPYTTLDRALIYKNQKLTTVITGASVSTFTQGCITYAPKLTNIYIGSATAPTLKQTGYPGFTFVDVENGDLKTTASNVIIHTPSGATGYDTDSTNVWSWPGCIKATTGTNKVEYGNYKGETFKLEDFTENVAAIHTWSISNDYSVADALHILYDRDSSGAKKA